MKKILIVLLAIIAYSIHADAAISPRRVVNFNSEWRFALGDYKGGSLPSFDDSKWSRVGLPHSFSIPYFMSKDFYVGYGWYRKHFKVDRADKTRSLFLEFDGVFQDAEVYVNGVRAGRHVGGYTGFSVDITSLVKQGDNMLAVRVNNLWKADVAPRAGEHTFSGGIYRDVRLVVKSRSYIDWYGTSVTTPDLAANQGKASKVLVQTDVCNHTQTACRYTLVTKVLDKQGRIVASASNMQLVKPGLVCTFRQTTPSVKNPQLWSPQHPTLYILESSLYQGKTLCDKDRTTFGFRWFEWTTDRGFFLNGEHLYFKGANVHQDQAGWGDAVADSAIYRDVQMVKDAGFDFIRGSHYPHAPAFVKACDEKGICFWSETPFWGIGGFKDDGYWDSSTYPIHSENDEKFEESALQQLGEMIRIFRNHPSIIVWSMCNEAFFSDSKVMPRVKSLLKKMVDATHRLDPTRPAAIGGSQRPLGKDRIDIIGDVAGYNGDGSTQSDFQHPSIPSMVSEYGSTTAFRPGEYIPGWGDLSKNDGWKGYPWRSGQAIWCAFDHGSIAGADLGRMGIIDYFRIPKRSWYWYRNEYRHIAPPCWSQEGRAAQLSLTSSKLKHILTDGTDDVHLLVSVRDAQGNELSNSPAVRLHIVSGPGEFPTGSSITFQKDSDIAIADGKAAIAFRSYHAGTTLIEASSPGLKSAYITLEFVGDSPYIKGVTPPVEERPYRRFESAQQQSAVQTFGVNNPTFASSQYADCSAGMAADGNVSTYWQPAANDTNPCWTLDTEKRLNIQQIQIAFAKESIYQYVVEISNDNKQWHAVLDKSQNQTGEKGFIIDLAGGILTSSGRFVRLRFKPASFIGISEVCVKGIVEP